MAQRRPFDSDAGLFEAAERVWWGLDEADWLEAFAAHPKIGDANALRAGLPRPPPGPATNSRARWAPRRTCSDRLADGNSRYEARFGYIFIVCATGKTAPEMLGFTRAAPHQRPDVEIKIAAAEQAKITRIRLEKIAP